MNRRERRAQAKIASRSSRRSALSAVDASAKPGASRLASVDGPFAQALQYHRAGQLPVAEQLYRQIVPSDARYADSLNMLGIIALQLGQYAQAVDLIGKANELQSNHAEAYGNLAAALIGVAKLDEAVAACDHALALKPDYIDAHYNRGLSLNDLGRFDEAVASYRRAIELKPDYSQAHNNLGLTLKAMGRLDEAIAAYRRAIELNPSFAKAYNNLGVALEELDRDDDAMTMYRQAESLSLPGFDNPLANQAVLLLQMGDTARALERTAQALAINPRSGNAWHIRSLLKTFGRDDPELAQMEALHASTEQQPLSAQDRLLLEFALGKAWMDAGESDRAFPHLHAGNRLKRATFSYDSDITGRWLTSIAETFTPELMQKFAGAGHSSDIPVFIIGMPRSGTTLTEQILASHPQVHGAGELNALREVVLGMVGQDGFPSLYPLGVPTLAPEQFAAMGRDYERRSGALSAGKRRVVDKMLNNFFYAGLIHLILPNARIIHCRRNAVDTCLSCYSKYFHGEQVFTYDLRELGLFYRGYEALMAHWRTLLPAERFIEIDYEDVVHDLETQARRLIAFCNLPWDDACLAFHKTRRRVRTASVNQVRQPLYASSVGAWKAHARHLGPLLAALQIDPTA